MGKILRWCMPSPSSLSSSLVQWVSHHHRHRHHHHHILEMAMGQWVSGCGMPSVTTLCTLLSSASHHDDVDDDDDHHHHQYDHDHYVHDHQFHMFEKLLEA